MTTKTPGVNADWRGMDHFAGLHEGKTVKGCPVCAETRPCPGCGSLNLPVAEWFEAPHDPAYHLVTRTPPTEVTDAQRLRNRARGGAYSVALTVTLQNRHGNMVDRVGSTRLARLYPVAALDNIILNTGGPVSIDVTTRSGVSVLKVRARFGGDFREVCTALHRMTKAMGGTLNVFDASEPASVLIQRGKSRATRAMLLTMAPVITVRRVAGRIPDVWVYEVGGATSATSYRTSERAVTAGKEAVRIAAERRAEQERREVADLLRDDVLAANQPDPDDEQDDRAGWPEFNGSFR